MTTPGAVAHDIAVTVNGAERRARVIPRMLLADVLREEWGLTGTHLGCEHGACGACTVLVDGEPTRACLMFAVQVDGCRVETVEGLAEGDGRLHPLQEAFRNRHALQCGFCTPGILMTLVAYLRVHPAPSEMEVREALSGNLCRCTGYQHIVQAVLEVVGGRLTLASSGSPHPAPHPALSPEGRGGSAAPEGRGGSAG